MSDSPIRTPVKTSTELEKAISVAVDLGSFVDRRRDMPRPPAGSVMPWPKRHVSDILGVCVHQSFSKTRDPARTAAYHTSRDNHITPGRPLPSIAYDFAVSPDDPFAQLVSEPLDRKYAQGSEKSPGDENLALISIEVLGKFLAPGVSRARHPDATTGPDPAQHTALWRIIRWCQATFGFGDEGLFYHADFLSKPGCPGFALMKEIDAIRDRVTGIISTDREAEDALRLLYPRQMAHVPDGVLDNADKRVLVKFQRENRLHVTGVLDHFTRLKLSRAAKAASGTV